MIGATGRGQELTHDDLSKQDSMRSLDYSIAVEVAWKGQSGYAAAGVDSHVHLSKTSMPFEGAEAR